MRRVLHPGLRWLAKRLGYDIRHISDSAGIPHSGNPLKNHGFDALNAHSIVSITSAEGKIVEVNQLFLDTFGYAEAEVLGTSVDCIYTRAARRDLDRIDSTLSRGDCWSGEQRLRRKDGGDVWTRTTIYPLFDADGNRSGDMSVRTCSTDVRLIHLERDMHAALHLLQDAVTIFTTDTCRYTYMNRASMRLWGVSEEDYLGTPIATHAPGFDTEAFLTRAQPLLRGEVSKLVYVSDLTGGPYEVTIQLIQSADGEPRFVSFERDIADKLAMEKAKDEFTATVSHELRSPLTSIKGGIGLVLSGAAGDLSDKVRGLLQIAYRNADRLVLIVNDILDLEKIAAGQMYFEMRPYEAGQLIREALTANEAYLANYGITARTAGLDLPITLYCDPDRMVQVLGNLLTNAAKFSDEQGEIRVALEQQDDNTVITVQDYGVGIPADAQETIFDRFTQAKPAKNNIVAGSGLGLSIVKSIVEKHDGRVEMSSVEGEGTTFRIILPERAADAGAPQRVLDQQAG